jgi:L-ascorbate metabolism protein UlaG (beta-lactamase superfamily)
VQLARSSFTAVSVPGSWHYGSVRLTKFAHSCVRLEQNGRALVIDPGVWAEPHALADADAVLVTHEHFDHIDELRLAGLGVPVFAPEGAAIGQVPFVPVRPGGRFTVAGFEVTVHGGRHAAVVPGQVTCPNVGFLVGGLYHPGDSLEMPGEKVETLLVPMQASWLKVAEAISFVQSAAPRRAFGIHDGQINDRAVSSINYWLGQLSGYQWIPPGTEVELT